MKKALTVKTLCTEARIFAKNLSGIGIPELYGVSDGKAVGTYVEHRFQEHLHKSYDYEEGNSARGIDFPKLQVDMKVTLIKQPQSSCPFKSARQKIYGLGYSLLIFVYEKEDNSKTNTAHLDFLHAVFVNKTKTADYQTTMGLRDILSRDGNTDDIIAYLMERHLPVDDIQASQLAEKIIKNPPEIGYLTISNALQWRLQYNRVIQKAGKIEGIKKII